MINSLDYDENILVRFRNVSKIYPGTLAVSKINMDIRKGEIHGLVGKNGAGKTTLVNLVSGVISPSEGDIYIGNKKFKSLSRIEAKRQGVDIVTQDPEIISTYTIAESLFSPNYLLKYNKLIDWDKIYSESKSILKMIGLNLNVETKMSDLSISMQQLIMLIKCFYIDKAPIIILDESSASLSDTDREILFKIILEKKNERAIIYISHRTDEVLKYCDVVTVLRDSKIVATERVSNLDEEKISTLVIGEKNISQSKRLEDKFDISSKNYGDVVLSVNNFNKVGFFQNVNFEVRKGEVVGLAGLRGSGRTEIMKSICGIDSNYKGYIKINGLKKHFTSPAKAYKSKIAYLTEEREREGIIDILSVSNNLSLIILKKISKIGLINKKIEKKTAEELVKLFDIKSLSVDQPVKFLSGGNKQKVVFGKIYAAEPKVYLLDEPTKGIDIATKEVLLSIIRNQLTQFAGIVLTAPGLEELIKVCDRILVLFEGKIIDEFIRENFDEQLLYLSIQGVNIKK